MLSLLRGPARCGASPRTGLAFGFTSTQGAAARAPRTNPRSEELIWQCRLGSRWWQALDDGCEYHGFTIPVIPLLLSQPPSLLSSPHRSAPSTPPQDKGTAQKPWQAVTPPPDLWTLLGTLAPCGSISCLGHFCGYHLQGF